MPLRVRACARVRCCERVSKELSFAQFATTVLPTQIPEGPGVHNIDPRELLTSPRFDAVFVSFVDFVQSVVDTSLAEVQSSDDEAELLGLLPSVRLPPPGVLLAAHNGLWYDFPLLISECLRHGCNAWTLAGWYYVDTLQVVRCCGQHLADGCARLQCLSRIGSCCGRQAHRALDDTVACRDVVRHLAGQMSMTAVELLKLFAREVDLGATLVNRTLLE